MCALGRIVRNTAMLDERHGYWADLMRVRMTPCGCVLGLILTVLPVVHIVIVSVNSKVAHTKQLVDQSDACVSVAGAVTTSKFDYD